MQAAGKICVWYQTTAAFGAEKYEILGKLPQTKNTFALSGYVPAYRADQVVREFSEKYDAVVETEQMKEDEAPPVLLKNNGFSESVEGVLASFGLPGKGEIDPTFFTSIFMCSCSDSCSATRPMD